MKSEEFQKTLAKQTIQAAIIKTIATLFVRAIVIVITYFIFKNGFHYNLNAFEIYALFLLQGIGSNQK